MALLFVLLLFFFFTPLLKLCISKASGNLDLKANIVCRFVSANPNRVSALLAGLILENLQSFDQKKIEISPRVTRLLLKEQRAWPYACF